MFHENTFASCHMTINFAQCGNYKFLTTNVFIIATKIVICKVIIPFKGYWQVHLSEAICPEVFYKKADLKKFTWKHQRQCFFFNKVASLIVTKHTNSSMTTFPLYRNQSIYLRMTGLFLFPEYCAAMVCSLHAFFSLLHHRNNRKSK